MLVINRNIIETDHANDGNWTKEKFHDIVYQCIISTIIANHHYSSSCFNFDSVRTVVNEKTSCIHFIFLRWYPLPLLVSSNLRSFTLLYSVHALLPPFSLFEVLCQLFYTSCPVLCLSYANYFSIFIYPSFPAVTGLTLMTWSKINFISLLSFALLKRPKQRNFLFRIVSSYILALFILVELFIHSTPNISLPSNILKFRI